MAVGGTVSAIVLPLTEPTIGTWTRAPAPGASDGMMPRPAPAVTQYLAGPYDLGRPWGCTGDRFGADTRLGSTPPTVVLSGPPEARTKQK